jgi:phospholipid/cholesterol/gamma-HCH transport system substrate-binding protein
LVNQAKTGKGSIGRLINDTSLAGKINKVANDFNVLDDSLSVLIHQLNQIATGINNEKGTIGAVIRDTGMVMQFRESLDNIKKGADNFNQNMEALKHNVLFRRHFRKKEKDSQKEKK